MKTVQQQPKSEEAVSPDELRSFVKELIQQEQTDEALDLLFDLIAAMQDENNRQALRIAQLLKHRFGKKSEKLDARQLSLFLQSVPESCSEDENEEDDSAKLIRLEIERLKELQKQGRKGRKRTGRNAIPDEIPRETELIEVPAEARTCGTCGEAKKPMGVETSEVLEFIPAQFKVIVYEREKLVCKGCGDGVVIAPAADKVLEGGRPGPGLLADIVVGKFWDGMPLNRLAGKYKRSGVTLPSSTLGQWVGVTADALEPLHKELKRLTLLSHILGVDDTGLKVLKKKGPKRIIRGHLWAYVGYEEGKPTRAVFDYTETWEGSGPLKFMAGRKGYIQGDGYSGYDPLFRGENPDCIKVGCMTHNRRYYTKALDGGDFRASIPLKIIQDLYAVEELAKLQELSTKERQKLRLKHAKPLLNKLGKWVEKVWPDVEPKTPLQRALTYTANQWESLIVYIDDGAIPIDNNIVEQQIRPIAVGRKGYLFAGSNAGAERAAILYSMMACCKLAKIEPLAWLTSVLTRLSKGWPNRRLSELLPENWVPDTDSD